MCFTYLQISVNKKKCECIWQMILKSFKCLFKFLADSWADVNKNYDNKTLFSTENNIHDCIQQLYLFKKKKQTLKMLLSVSEWMFFKYFAVLTFMNWKHNHFTETAVTLIKNFDFDDNLCIIISRKKIDKTQTSILIENTQQMRVKLQILLSSWDLYTMYDTRSQHVLKWS